MRRRAVYIGARDERGGGGNVFFSGYPRCGVSWGKRVRGRSRVVKVTVCVFAVESEMSIELV